MVEPRPLDPETCRDGHNLRHYSRHWTRLFSHDQRYEKKNYLRRRMLQYGTIIERGLKKT